MATFLEIAVIAFITQLSVLPGEKVQFIIAALSTRYRPLIVVGAAGAAFAGWTALEILFGRALQELFPGIVLDLFTATLFLLFAVLLIRSAPGGPNAPVSATDGGLLDAAGIDIDADFRMFGYSIGGGIGQFLSIFSLMAAGEFGDKTQLVTIGLAVQYGATPAIWVGEMLAIIPVSLANAYFFHRFAHRFDMRKAHYAGALLFAFFGIDTLLSVVIGVSVWETGIGIVTNIVTNALP